MYIRGLIPRNFAELAKAVPIATQSDQSLRCPYEGPWLPIMRLARALIRRRTYKAVFFSVSRLISNHRSCMYILVHKQLIHKMVNVKSISKY